MLWTLITEDYEVTICKTVKDVISHLDLDNISLEAESETPSTRKAIEQALRANRVTRLFDVGHREWYYRVQQQA